MVKLSALVCVQDQDENLSECLRRLWFCDEIVVVADRCGEAMGQVARRHGAVLTTGAFPLATQRRAAGLEAASGDWILEIAPDERVDSALAWEIRATLKMRPEFDRFELPLANHVGERLIRHGWTAPLGSDGEVRLYRREVADGDRAVTGALTGQLRREIAGGASGLIAAFDRITSRSAEQAASDGQRVGIGSALAGGMAGFFRSYVARGGWREGGLGLVLAALAGLFPLVARVKAQEALDARLRALAAGRREGVQATVLRLGVG